MKIIIIGSGLIGVTTAYYLSRCGHEVTVLDRQAGVGRETSFANGTLLTPSMADPWNAPGCWRVLLGSVGRSNAAMQLRLRALPALAGWGTTFLRNSVAHIFERNSLSNRQLALYSIEAMHLLRELTGIEYGRTARGTLRIFRDRAAIDEAAAVANRRSHDRLVFRRLSREETVKLEPALVPIEDQLAGALHYENDETGDAYEFCVALADHARQQGVEFRFHTEVSSLDMLSGRITSVATKRERFSADLYIVAAGSYSAPLLRTINVHLPVQPAKGYSVTFDSHDMRTPLSIPVIDDNLHAAVVPFNGGIRVAGTAEFAGYDRVIRPARIRNLVSLLQEVLPQERFDLSVAKSWCGLRPMSVDGVPIIGPTQVSNLLVSTGHGPLGWTMAAGSAQLLTDLVCGKRPSIDPAPFALARYRASRSLEAGRC